MRFYFLLLCLGSLLNVGAAAPNEQRKPNVIVIMADDQGSVDAGCYGSRDLTTPAIDSLASHGVRFTQFYSGPRFAPPPVPGS